MDISKPLRQDVFTRIEAIKTLLFYMKYEKSPDFYFRCGVVTHIEHKCVHLGKVWDGKDTSVCLLALSSPCCEE